MDHYILKKEDKTVLINKVGEIWNYKKEFGSCIVENFKITYSQVFSLLLELEEFNYKIIERPEPVLIHTKSGCIKYELFGKTHRENGPAFINSAGTEFWYLEGLKHRKNDPAVECVNGNKEWWLNGERHREDGPACEYNDGTKYWFINGQELTKEEYNNRKK